jgi:hypothetical protein
VKGFGGGAGVGRSGAVGLVGVLVDEVGGAVGEGDDVAVAVVEVAVGGGGGALGALGAVGELVSFLCAAPVLGLRESRRKPQVRTFSGAAKRSDAPDVDRYAARGGYAGTTGLNGLGLTSPEWCRTRLFKDFGWP